jgi:hypothetical protein
VSEVFGDFDRTPTTWEDGIGAGYLGPNQIRAAEMQNGTRPRIEVNHIDQLDDGMPIPNREREDPLYKCFLQAVGMRAEHIQKVNGGILNPDDVYNMARQEVANLANDPAQFPITPMLKTLQVQNEKMADLTRMVQEMKMERTQVDRGSSTSTPLNIMAPIQRIPVTTMMRGSVDTDIAHDNVTNADNTVKIAGVNYTFPASDDNMLKRRPMDLIYYKGDGTQSWDSFIRSFMQITRHNRWTKDETSMQLMRAITGMAADYLFDDPLLGDCPSLDTIIDIMGQRFGNLHNLALESKNLRLRKKQKGETWSQMIGDIKHMCNKLYKNDAEAIARESASAFLRGIPEKFKLSVTATGSEDIEVLAKSVRHMCAILELDEKDCYVPTARVGLVSDEHRSDEVPNCVNYSAPGRRPNTRYSYDMTNVECYGCRQKGHMIKDCPLMTTKQRCSRCYGFGHGVEKCPTSQRPMQTQQKENFNKLQ